MLQILEEPTVRERAMPVSVEGYHCMLQAGLVSEKAELIRGVIIEKMSKSPLHIYFTDLLAELAKSAISAGQMVRQESPLTLADSEPEPDLAIVQGQRADYLTSHPTTALLVIEIATSSERLDREMATIYAEAGVQEYWIILGQKRAVEIFRRPVNGVYQEQQIFQLGETIQSVIIPGWTLAVSDIFPA